MDDGERVGEREKGDEGGGTRKKSKEKTRSEKHKCKSISHGEWYVENRELSSTKRITKYKIIYKRKGTKQIEKEEQKKSRQGKHSGTGGRFHNRN